MSAPPGLLALYPRLSETNSADPDERTRLNVRDSDATLLLTGAAGRSVSPGTEATAKAALDMGRPLLEVDPDARVGGPDALAAASRFIASVAEGGKLNVAGPRESESPGIYRTARLFLEDLLSGRMGCTLEA
jgi:hypothetical protein